MEPQIAQIGADYEQNADPETYAVIGAAMEVHRELGSGFLEAVYQDAFAIELGRKDIPFSREKLLPVQYKGELLKCSYKADFVCFDSVIVELKVVEALNSNHAAQIINYLKATGIKKGLLLNFRSGSLQYKRLVNKL